MRTLISGSSGMIGNALSSFLIEYECPVVKLLRKPNVDSLTEISWNIEKGEIDSSKLEGFDAVIHLAGANIAEKMWTKKRKKQIMDSRLKSTKLLVENLVKLNQKPKVFIVASGMNVYGNNEADGKPFDEESPDRGVDFLADVVREWERAAKLANNAGIRVCYMRFGAVIGPTGGLLKKVLPIFRWAAGGRLGTGKQMLSWVSIEDAVAAIWHCLNKEEVSGPVNICSENAVNNLEFTKTLAKAVGLPAIFPMPVFMIKAIFAEMGESLMLSDITCKPGKLLSSGFEFSQPTLRECFNHQLNVNVKAKVSVEDDSAT